ncbi:MAG TPA: CpaD family pilus assembly protein [Caulobacteraceae bacterium]|nr:CpaD family pilus assembly protein [Caulobacteraceae bacterium]
MSSNKAPEPAQARATAGRLAGSLGVALALLLGACATEHTGQGNPNPITPTERYSIQVRPAPEELRLAPHPAGLSPPQAQALGDFVRRWMDADGGAITLKAPQHGGDPASAYRTATSARDFLLAQGVSPRQVRIVGYEAGGDARAPIVVGFMRYRAIGPKCGRTWGDLSADSDNREYDEFGCSMTANFAAQIADPADLLAPRRSAPPDANRRETVMGKYQQGVITSTPKDDQADASFAKVGQ